jgi:hypothetical protein
MFCKGRGLREEEKNTNIVKAQKMYYFTALKENK